MKVQLPDGDEGGALRLIADTQAIRYTGSSLDPSLVSSGATLLVGVYHRETGTVQLSRPSRLFVMHPRLKEPVVSLEAGGVSGTTERRSLAAELGSEKSRKKLKAIAATRIHADKIYNQGSLEQDIDTAMSAAPAAASIEDSAEARPLLPKHDKEALSTRTAYPRGGLVPDKIWDILEVKKISDSAQSATLLQEMDKDKKMWPPFVMRRLRIPRVDKQELGMLLYLTYLLRFSAANRPMFSPEDGESGPRPRNPLQRDTPPAVWNQLVRDFSDPLPPRAGSTVVHRRINDGSKHKIALHTHAMAIWLTEGNMLSSELAPSLQLTEERCTFYLRQLGCTVVQKARKDGTDTDLPLPLKFPRLERGGRGPSARG